jgi:hypothetical protein
LGGLALVVLSAQPGGSVGLGSLIVAVGVLMAFGAGLSLRSIWGKQVEQDAEQPRTGPLNPRAKPLRSPAVGQMRTWLRLLLSFDFGCLAVISAVLLLLGMILIFRGLGV